MRPVMTVKDNVGRIISIVITAEDRMTCLKYTLLNG